MGHLQKLLLVIGLIGCQHSLYATLPKFSAIELRVGSGNDLNSGMYSSRIGDGTACTVGGTDYTQQNGPQVTFDGATITAVTAGVSATITITGYTVATTDVCNTLRIASGTNFTASLYQIVSVSTGAGTWTLDRNVATGVGAAMVGRMGGALATLRQAVVTDWAINSRANQENQPTVWSKLATETITTAIDVAPTAGGWIRGYDTVRGDHTGNRPTLTTATNSITLLRPTDNFQYGSLTIENYNLTNTAGTRAPCISGGASTMWSISVINSLLDGCSYGLWFDSGTNITYQAQIINTEIKNCTIDALRLNTGNVLGSYIHDNTGLGVQFGGSSPGFHMVIDRTTIESNGSFGARLQIGGPYYTMQITNSNFYNNNALGAATAQIQLESSDQAASLVLVNNIIEGGTCGVKMADTVGTEGTVVRTNNAFYNTTPYCGTFLPTEPTDITLTGSAWTNAASGNFVLNNTTGAGAAMKAVGYPTNAAGTGANYLDLGPLQSQAPSGGGNSSYAQ